MGGLWHCFTDMKNPNHHQTDNVKPRPQDRLALLRGHLSRALHAGCHGFLSRFHAAREGTPELLRSRWSKMLGQQKKRENKTCQFELGILAPQIHKTSVVSNLPFASFSYL